METTRPPTDPTGAGRVARALSDMRASGAVLAIIIGRISIISRLIMSGFLLAIIGSRYPTFIIFAQIKEG